MDIPDMQKLIEKLVQQQESRAENSGLKNLITNAIKNINASNPNTLSQAKNLSRTLSKNQKRIVFRQLRSLTPEDVGHRITNETRSHLRTQIELFKRELSRTQPSNRDNIILGLENNMKPSVDRFLALVATLAERNDTTGANKEIHKVRKMMAPQDVKKSVIINMLKEIYNANANGTARQNFLNRLQTTFHNTR